MGGVQGHRRARRGAGFWFSDFPLGTRLASLTTPPPGFTLEWRCAYWKQRRSTDYRSIAAALERRCVLELTTTCTMLAPTNWRDGGASSTRRRKSAPDCARARRKVSRALPGNSVDSRKIGLRYAAFCRLRPFSMRRIRRKVPSFVGMHLDVDRRQSARDKVIYGGRRDRRDGATRIASSATSPNEAPRSNSVAVKLHKKQIRWPSRQRRSSSPGCLVAHNFVGVGSVRIEYRLRPLMSGCARRPEKTTASAPHQRLIGED